MWVLMARESSIARHMVRGMEHPRIVAMRIPGVHVVVGRITALSVFSRIGRLHKGPRNAIDRRSKNGIMMLSRGRSRNGSRIGPSSLGCLAVWRSATWSTGWRHFLLN